MGERFVSGRKWPAGAYWFIELSPRKLDLRAGEMVRMEIGGPVANGVQGWLQMGADFVMTQREPGGDGWRTTPCEVSTIEGSGLGMRVRLEFRTLSAVPKGMVSTYCLIMQQGEANGGAE